MTDTTFIVSDVRAVVVHLADLGDVEVRIAQALDAWLRGTDFETALGLQPGWRNSLQHSARTAALAALLKVHRDLDDQTLARRIVAGVIQAAANEPGVRPDGEVGRYHDLAHAQIHLSERSWRRLIAEARGQSDQRLATTAFSLWSASKLGG